MDKATIKKKIYLVALCGGTLLGSTEQIADFTFSFFFFLFDIFFFHYAERCRITSLSLK